MPDPDTSILKLTPTLTNFDKKNECYFIYELVPIFIYHSKVYSTPWALSNNNFKNINFKFIRAKRICIFRQKIFK